MAHQGDALPKIFNAEYASANVGEPSCCDWCELLVYLTMIFWCKNLVVLHVLQDVNLPFKWLKSAVRTIE